MQLVSKYTGGGRGKLNLLRRMDGKVGKVYGDKAYLATECFNLIDGKGGTAIR